jgi:hypothetical protein
MKKIITLAIFAAIILQSCTNVDEVVYDKYASKDFYSSSTGADVALASVYAQIPGNWNGIGYAGADNGWYDVNSMSTDEQVVPHRTTGDWELTFAQMYLREWLPDHSQINNTWNWLYKSVYNANLAVDLLQKANADPAKIAEAHVLRDFFYYLLIDDFGNVPFYTDNNITIDKLPQESRSVIFNYILTDLKDNIDKLSTVRGGVYYGRFNKWAGYALLAKLYLNAEVYTGTAMWTECMAACDVVTSGGFTLHTGALDASNPLGSKYFELFGDVCPNDETILAIYTTVDLVGRNIFTVRSLGGTDATVLFGYSGWNGSVIPEDYVDKFDNNDIRKHQFRYGSNPFGPQPAGFINYSLTVSNLDNPGAAPNEGARSQKFWPALPMNSGGASNDFPIYRYADIMLMKAECLVRTGDVASAKPLVDAIRVRAGLTGLAANPTLTDIYNERGFELSWEGHRREDMIRFGTFTLAHGLAPAVDDHYKLFPIPTSALNANTKLVQNPGY